MIQGTHNVDRPISRSRRWWQRRGIWLLSIVLLGGVLFAYPSVHRWARTERSIDGDRLRLTTVARGDLERDVTVEGRVVAAYHPTLFSPAPGLVQLHVMAGEPVTPAQLLATIESPELTSRLDQERSTLLSLGSELERLKLSAKQLDLQNAQQVDLLTVRVDSAERAMARAQRTFDEGVTGAAEFERAQDALAIARLELEHARRTVALDRERVAFEVRNQELQVERQRLLVAELERQVKELEIRSPVAGLTSRIDVQDRDAVVAGQPLLAVVDLSAFEVEIGVPEGIAGEVEIGTAASVILAGERFAGEVVRIAPSVEGSVVRGRVTFTAASPDGLKQNQRVTTRLILEARRDVLKVERGPFLESGGGRQAYVVEDQIASPRRIEVGAVSVSEVEIVSGLELGEQIVLSDTARFAGADNVLIRD
ncbi:MAG: HlyD family efflux transporter periplasmic adaptor subunit [Acidobacteriota bacterium]